MAAFVYLVLALVTLTSFLVTCDNIIPLADDVWWKQNHDDGILEGDTFSVFSFNYPYMSLYIDERKFMPMAITDEDTKEND